MLIPLQWIGLFAVVAVFVVMFTLGLMLGREQIAAALARRGGPGCGDIRGGRSHSGARRARGQALSPAAGRRGGDRPDGDIAGRARCAAARAGCRRRPAFRTGAASRHRAACRGDGPGKHRDPQLDIQRGIRRDAVRHRPPGILRAAPAARARGRAARLAARARREVRAATRQGRQRVAACPGCDGAHRPAGDHRRDRLDAECGGLRDDDHRAGGRGGVRRRQCRCAAGPPPSRRPCATRDSHCSSRR